MEPTDLHWQGRMFGLPGECIDEQRILPGFDPALLSRRPRQVVERPDQLRLPFEEADRAD